MYKHFDGVIIFNLSRLKGKNYMQDHQDSQNSLESFSVNPPRSLRSCSSDPPPGNRNQPKGVSVWGGVSLYTISSVEEAGMLESSRGSSPLTQETLGSRNMPDTRVGPVKRTRIKH